MRTHGRRAHQDLPREWPAREALREKGQFWTPGWVAEAMVSFALGGGASHIFDPAVGAGAFFAATERVARDLGPAIALLGTEVDPTALEQARAAGLESDLSGVELRDFVLDPPPRHFAAIVANPPYIRHHRLDETLKSELRRFGASAIGRPLDGRAGYHIYFLIRALLLLEEGGRLAFIMPADTCEGVFAPALWGWIAARYRIEAVVTFSPEATPFPGVDTNALIFMLSRTEPRQWFHWARCERPEGPELLRWCRSGFAAEAGTALGVRRRELAEALRTGLSRPPVSPGPGDRVLLDFARVVRGIATGANEFFLLTSRQVAELEVPDRYLRRAVARTRDVDGNEITQGDLERLDAAGRPTYLLSLGSEPVEALPPKLRAYLRAGEASGLPRRPLIATRSPWYRMEVRQPPALLFAYLGRRQARFIRNAAGAVPLTGFLCVYPRRDDRDYVDRLWTAVSAPRTLANLSLVGKSYGDGAIKVEPRALERLPIPAEVVEGAQLDAPDRPDEVPTWPRQPI